MNINNIISSIVEYAKPNLYRVEVLAPNTMINGKVVGEDKGFFNDLIRDLDNYVEGKVTAADARMVSLSCSTIVMPGVSYATRDVRSGSGPLTKVPYDKIYEPLTATFYNDSEHTIRKFFIQWMRGMNSTVTNSVQDGNRYAFYNDYIGGMRVYQLDANRLPSAGVEFAEIYPTALGEVALAYESGDSIQTFTVTFNYRSWSEININRIAGRVLDEIKETRLGKEVFDGIRNLL